MTSTHQTFIKRQYTIYQYCNVEIAFYHRWLLYEEIYGHNQSFENSYKFYKQRWTSLSMNEYKCVYKSTNT